MFGTKNKNGCFDCDNCPMTADTNAKRYCVMWWEIIMNNEDGKQKVEKGCGFSLMPVLMIESIKAADHSVAASYDMRNKVVSAFTQYLNTGPQELPEKESDPKRIEVKEID